MECLNEQLTLFLTVNKTLKQNDVIDILQQDVHIFWSIRYQNLKALLLCMTVYTIFHGACATLGYEVQDFVYKHMMFKIFQQRLII